MKLKIFIFIGSILLIIQSCDRFDLHWDLPQLPEVETSDVTTIMDVSFNTGGEIVSDGGGVILEKGVCYSTSYNPTIKNSVVKSNNVTEIFTVKIEGLTPKTEYHIRAFATNKAGTAYGNEASCVTKGIATIVTTDANSITLNTAVCGGIISNDGGFPITERGVCYNTTENPTINNYKVDCGSGLGTFTATLNNLSSSTTYYIRAYARNYSGIAYGQQVIFKTAGYPTLSTDPVTSIKQTTAISGGNITDGGGANIIERGVCYNLNPNPIILNYKIKSGTGTGTFSVGITGLVPNTKYYLRAYAVNTFGISYGNEVVFNTLSITYPTVSTKEPSSITTTTATSGGNITDDGGSVIVARGVCWSELEQPTIAFSHTTDGEGTGEFSSSITGLSAQISYYVRAYATNSYGTSYGDQIKFTTPVHYVGQLYGGGIVFYLDNTGEHGLITPVDNQSVGLRWYNGTYITTGATGTLIGTGYSNTSTIVSKQGTGSYAAKLCYDLVIDLYNDWYLPSKDELNLMYLNKTVISNFTSGAYWTSSEVSKNYAWTQFIDSGLQSSTHPKSDAHYVRAIRAF